MKRSDRLMIADAIAGAFDQTPRIRQLLDEGRKSMKLGKYDLLDAFGRKRGARGRWVAPLAVGLGVGAFVGAALALLFSPRSGDELREELLERGRRVVQRGREKIEDYGGSPNTPST